MTKQQTGNSSPAMAKPGMARKRLSATLLALVMGLFPSSTTASQGSVYFGGNLTYNNACVILIQGDGTFVPSADTTLLSSKLAGGQAGEARIYSIWEYEVTVDSPGFFTAPTQATIGTTFTTTFSGQSIYRGRTFGERNGSNGIRLRRGFSVTDVDVHLEAERPNGFPSGAYSATTIVRCEP